MKHFVYGLWAAMLFAMVMVSLSAGALGQAAGGGGATSATPAPAVGAPTKVGAGEVKLKVDGEWHYFIGTDVKYKAKEKAGYDSKRNAPKAKKKNGTIKVVVDDVTDIEIVNEDPSGDNLDVDVNGENSDIDLDSSNSDITVNGGPGNTVDIGGDNNDVNGSGTGNTLGVADDPIDNDGSDWNTAEGSDGFVAGNNWSGGSGTGNDGNTVQGSGDPKPWP